MVWPRGRARCTVDGMQLLVIRHGIAEDRDAFAATGEDDAQRPLTKRGEGKMKAVAAGLRHVVGTLDTLAASSLVRAQQTAEIVAESYGDMPVETVKALSPDSEPRALLGWLRQRGAADVVAIVGHEPHLGILVTWLMTGQVASRVTLRKGGACLLDFSAHVASDAGTLQWALTPSQLRRIGS
jgi:phosphohistidine phosphatase